ncbi:putative ribonuclease H-like domain-containing protein [Tanacetum coccineum]|uniref:Ribonuclease H-like domain-containing protein n=1 Tax=Tanacetum coccineum TaxID=301880 RepID=A0ABQ4XIW7_9ASTR
MEGIDMKGFYDAWRGICVKKHVYNDRPPSKAKITCCLFGDPFSTRCGVMNGKLRPYNYAFLSPTINYSFKNTQLLDDHIHKILWEDLWGRLKEFVEVVEGTKAGLDVVIGLMIDHGFIFLIVRNGGQFEYWKAELEVVKKIKIISCFTIEEEVYVHQPLGFVDLAHPNKVYKVIKALYGLHQAPRAWYETLCSFLMENGFRRVKQQHDGIFISQDKYVADILKKFNFLSIRKATTPIESNKPLVKDEDSVDVDVHVYRSMIGSLMYLTTSRPDIMFVVCAYARFQVTPKASHLNAVKRIFRYLKHQPKLGLWYPRDSPFELEAYSDSDYGGASLDRKSTTGGCQFLGRRLISWQCKKQTIVANSTTEAEYVAAANCCGQVLWIQNQMMDYGFNFMNTKIHIDNESTISVIKNPVAHSRTKHIEIRFHFIRDCYEKRLIEVIKIHTDSNVADLLTKGFDVTRFNFLVVSIGLLNL